MAQPLRHVDLARRAVPSSAYRLRTLIRSALLFTVDQSDIVRPPDAAPLHLRMIHQLEQRLRSEFFHDIWVRPEPFQELSEQLGDPGYRVIHGVRGSGKSTMLSALWLESLRVLNANSHLETPDLRGYSAHYINLRAYGSTVRRPETRDSGRNGGGHQNADNASTPHRVCGIVFRHIFEWVFPITELLSNGDDEIDVDPLIAWDIHKFHTSAHYSPVREMVYRLKRQTGHTLESILYGDVGSEKFLRSLEDADQAFSLDEDDQLKTLLRYLAERNHVPIVFIDNVDRYGNRLSLELDRTLLELCSSDVSLSAFVAMRTSAFQRLPTDASDATRQAFPLGVSTRDLLRPSDTAGGGGLIEQLPKPKTQDERPPVVDEELSEDRDSELRDEMLLAIAHRRFDFLKTFLLSEPVLSYTRDTVDAELLDIGIQSLDEYFRLCLEAARSQLRNFDALDAKWILLQWHNYSIRSCLAHLIDIMTVTISGQDPLFPAAQSVAATEAATAEDVHELRSLMWRHLIFAEQKIGSEAETCIDLLSAYPQVGGDIPLSFPHLRVLQVISNSGSVTWRTLIRTFEDLNLQDEVLLANILHSLSSSRGYESEGLVRVDIAPSRLNARMPDDTLIKTRVAGRFMLRRLLRSCEYIFWSAMSVESPRLRDRMDISGTINEATAVEDAYRATVAARFVEFVVCPAIERDFLIRRWTNDERASRLAALQRVLPDDSRLAGGWNIAPSLSRSISTFVKHITDWPDARSRQATEAAVANMNRAVERAAKAAVRQADAAKG